MDWKWIKLELKYMYYLEVSLNFLTVVIYTFFSVRLWNVPGDTLADSDNLFDNSAKVCLFIYSCISAKNSFQV